MKHTIHALIAAKMFNSFEQYIEMLIKNIPAYMVKQHADFIKKSFEMDVSIPTLVKELKKKKVT